MVPAAGLLDYLTLALTWPQGAVGAKKNHLEAAQVNGIVGVRQSTLVRHPPTRQVNPSPVTGIEIFEPKSTLHLATHDAQPAP
jgi:hypothetical protein